MVAPQSSIKKKMRAVCGTLQRGSLIWMLPLLSVKHPHSCWENKLGRSQEEQQWMAWTPQWENKVHPPRAAQRDAAFPLCCLLSSGQRCSPGSAGRRWFLCAGLAAGTLLPLITRSLWRTCSFSWPFCCPLYSTAVPAGDSAGAVAPGLGGDACEPGPVLLCMLRLSLRCSAGWYKVVL